VECGGEHLEVLVRKRRFRCRGDACPKRTFVQATEQIPFRAMPTTRLVERIVHGLSTELRAVSALAAAARVSWTTAMRVLARTADVPVNVDRRLVRLRGVDEHRFRRVRYLKNCEGKVTRVEPWSIVFTDLDSGAVLAIADGRRGQAVCDWIRRRPRWWRRRVEPEAMDMSSEFRGAVRTVLPRAAITDDHFHVVARANQMITEVRRCRSHDLHGRRGRATDPAWKSRRLLICNQQNMSLAQRRRLQKIIAADIELGVVWGIKEHVRQLLANRNISDFQQAPAELEHAVAATKMREAKSLFLTLKL
jgi:transposase